MPKNPLGKLLSRERTFFASGFGSLVLIFLTLIFMGAVDIPASDIVNVLLGKDVDNPYYRTIIIETRLPMAIAASCCGATLSVAGLMMQTVFNNPLAGPSVLGISSGSSFGVALFMLSGGGMAHLLTGCWQPFLSLTSALAGGLVIIVVLLVFSSVLRSIGALLIVGLMISYLCSSGISLLNYFSPADEIRNFLVWGLGSFSGLRFSSSLWLFCFSIIAILPAFLFVKPLNAMLLGERHLESVGYSLRQTRNCLLFLTGLLVAVSTAFCGPIGFIGLIVPHICRLMFQTSNHLLLLPAVIIFGAVACLVCALLTVLPSATFGVLPVNTITPFIGVPVILYLLINRNKLPYFS